MRNASALRDGGRSTAAASRRSCADPLGPSGGSFLSQQLERLSDRFDALLRDCSITATTHREVERRADEARDIAERLDGLFRKPVRREAAPLREGGGRAWW